MHLLLPYHAISQQPAALQPQAGFNEVDSLTCMNSRDFQNLEHVCGNMDETQLKCSKIWYKIKYGISYLGGPSGHLEI